MPTTPDQEANMADKPPSPGSSATSGPLPGAPTKRSRGRQAHPANREVKRRENTRPSTGLDKHIEEAPR
jgi:hypothetical protein